MGRHETPRTGHPLGLTGKVLLGAALTGVGMGLTPGLAAADTAPNPKSTSDSRPAPVTDVRSMTDRELGQELGRVSGKDTLRTQEVVTEMKLRGTQFVEPAQPTRGIGISGSIPVRPGVSVTGTLAYDPNNGSVITSLGARAGKPTAPQVTGIAPKPDGLNAEANANVKLGQNAELGNKFSLNVAPDGTVTGSYKAKGTVTTPDGRNYEMDVTVERQPDGTYNLKGPDGVNVGTQLPGGSSIDVKAPTDVTAAPEQPEIKGPAPDSGYKPFSGWFDASGALSIDKEFRRTSPLPTPEEVDRAKADFARSQAEQRRQNDQWMAQNRPEAVQREAQETIQDRVNAIEAARQQALPDQDRDGVPDESDATPNENNTDPASTDVGDGPEGNPGYGSDRVDNPPVSSPPEGTDPNGDLDGDGLSNGQDATWNQNDTDPASTDVGDGPEGNAGYTGSGTGTPEAATDTSPDTSPDAGSGYSGSGDNTGGGADLDGDGLTGSADATPNQNDTDPASTDVGDGPEGNAGYPGSTGADSGAGYSDSGFGDNTGSADSGSTDSGSGSFSGSLDSGSGYSDSGFGDNGGSADTGSGYSDSGYSDSGSGGFDSGSSGGYDSGGSGGFDSGGFGGDAGACC